MNILICGWYGTETLGDRAILAGIFKIIGHAIGKASIKIASLYPFFTKRTLMEDRVFYETIGLFQLDYFDVNDKSLLEDEIKKSNLVLFGGGPIMDLMDLEIIRYIFISAKRKGKKTAVFGCGVGPLYKKQFIRSAEDILKHSDLIIFRDPVSVNTAKELFTKSELPVLFTHDPAILACYHYKQLYENDKVMEGETVAVNMREFKNIGFKGDRYISDNVLVELLINLSKNYDHVTLVPMHTFGIGGDDRFYLTNLQSQAKKQNIHVLHQPMDLFRLFDRFTHATACVGMRYHSVVFQTLLNGNNCILDYTDSVKGKIGSFVSMLEPQSFYDNRRVNLLQDTSVVNLHAIPTLLAEKKHFCFNESIYRNTLALYVDRLCRLIDD